MGSFIKWENFPKIQPYLKLFGEGTVVTVMLSVFTVAIGFVLALILSSMRLSNFHPLAFLGTDREGRKREEGALLAVSKFNPLSFLATAYVEILRSTPVIVQVAIIYYGIFGQLVDLPSFKIFGFIKFERFFPVSVGLWIDHEKRSSDLPLHKRLLPKALRICRS